MTYDLPRSRHTGHAEQAAERAHAYRIVFKGPQRLEPHAGFVMEHADRAGSAPRVCGKVLNLFQKSDGQAGGQEARQNGYSLRAMVEAAGPLLKKRTGREAASPYEDSDGALRMFLESRHVSPAGGGTATSITEDRSAFLSKLVDILKPINWAALGFEDPAFEAHFPRIYESARHSFYMIPRGEQQCIPFVPDISWMPTAGNMLADANRVGRWSRSYNTEAIAINDLVELYAVAVAAVRAVAGENAYFSMGIMETLHQNEMLELRRPLIAVMTPENANGVLMRTFEMSRMHPIINAIDILPDDCVLAMLLARAAVYRISQGIDAAYRKAESDARADPLAKASIIVNDEGLQAAAIETADLLYRAYSLWDGTIYSYDAKSGIYVPDEGNPIHDFNRGESAMAESVLGTFLRTVVGAGAHFNMGRPNPLSKDPRTRRIVTKNRQKADALDRMISEQFGRMLEAGNSVQIETEGEG